MTKPKGKLRDFRTELIKKLRNPEAAKSFYKAILQEARYCKDQEEANQLIAFARNMIREAKK